MEPDVSNQSQPKIATRIAGAWWNHEPYTELELQRLDSGKLLQVRNEFKSLGTRLSKEPLHTTKEDHREDWDLRKMKLRDEKVARACGFVKEPDYHGISYIRSTQSYDYAVLHAISGYGFGRGAMLAEEIAPMAKKCGASAALIADPFSLTGAYEFYKICRQVGIKPLIGASIELPEGGEIVLVAKNPIGYRSLSRLITECHIGEPRLHPLSTWDRLAKHNEGLLCLSGGAGSLLNWHLALHQFSDANALCEKLESLYGKGNVFLQIERTYLPGEDAVNQRLLELAQHRSIIPVAGGPITHTKRSTFPVQDVISCVHWLCTIEELEGRKPHRHPSQPPGRVPPPRALNAERCIRPAAELAELYRDNPQLLLNTLLVSDLCEDNVLPGRTELPPYAINEEELLVSVIQEGMQTRRPNAPKGFQKRTDAEVKRIIRLGFTRHFLVAWDMCRHAREIGVHFSARGSVVDSVVAYLLGMSRIDAFEHRLHFDRFLPADGSKRPDIDIDFEAFRREDIRQYLVQKYGTDHVATVGAVGAYCSRGIIREVGKVMGLPDEHISFLSKRLHGGISPDRLEAALDKRPELRKSGIDKERYRWVFQLAERMMDLPRNMRAHSSGVIISREPICDTVPLMWSGAEGVKIIQWDKRSAKHCFDKFDILCLRGQDVLSETEESIRRKELEFCVESVSLDDPETYRAIRSGQLIGIPQSASPAMRQAHVRLRTENLTDASLVQAGIRPGVGGAVKINELIKRRRGANYTFDHPKLQDILGNTYGIIVFQEQVDQLLQEFGGYTSGEAEDIRESIFKKRREDFAQSIKSEVIKRIVDNGFAQVIADQVYDLVSGFNGYGFAQGHALAFAEISVRCVWLQQHHPGEYFCALLNAQPAGYYGPTTIANEARIRGAKILHPDVNISGVKFAIEDVKADQDPKLVLPNGGIRVGFAQIHAISAETKQRIVNQQLQASFTSMFDFAARVQPNRDELETLILCGCFDQLHSNRRALLWSIPLAQDYAKTYAGLNSGTLPLILGEPQIPTDVADFSIPEKAIYERQLMGLDIHHHLMQFERPRIAAKGGVTSHGATLLPPGTKAFVVGNPIRLRFPPTKTGKRVVFFDLEDETGLLNVTCFDDVYQKYGHSIICSSYATVFGEVQDRDGYPAFLADRVMIYKPTLRSSVGSNLQIPVGASDFIAR